MGHEQKVLVVDDDEQMQIALKTSLSRAGYDVTLAGDGATALICLEKGSFDVVVSDQRMPQMSGQELLEAMQEREITTPFIMITAHGTIDQAVKAMQHGAADFIAKPFSAEDLTRVIERVISPENQQFRAQNSDNGDKKDRTIITNDPMMIRVLEVADAVARSDATVLVQGESGTGKELVARMIHSASARSRQPFVAVNCAALPDNLLESELFGHEKGAFTGAQARKPGKFELAQGGTILLDEISEMDLALQAKLLRVLQEREVDRVGGKEPISIDVRVVATTNRNLEQAARMGTFRSDLYYRLNVIPITLPPLRERRGDVRLLTQHFMKKYLRGAQPQIPDVVWSALENHPWPGNIRELQNAVERAAILSQGKNFTESHFLMNSPLGSLTPLHSNIEKTIESVDAIGSNPLEIRSGTTVQEMEKALILETLKATNENRTKAAELLGISIRTLRNKLNEYGYSKG
ncbi:MAG: sigma-54-dependent Fis family transcriptional regulator [Bdellovibrionales bacterium]|nr:sigma-54-dependent Fis family transcriptional regulator [Bdellovibrionales bacterium]